MHLAIGGNDMVRSRVLKRGKTLVHRVGWGLRQISAARRGGVPVPVLGNLGHLRPSLYAKVLHELDLVPVAPKQTSVRSPVGIVWKPRADGTHHDLYHQLEAVGRVRPHIHLINLTHFNVDTARVQAEFERTFGYSLGVDPTTHVGPAVTKSRVNGRRTIVMCPVDEVDPDAVYQLPIDNITDDGHIEDIRMSLVSYTPEVCYLRYRPLADRLSDIDADVRLGSMHDLLSDHELSCISGFARNAGLECGEVDVVRDRESRQIYIVDAHNTPYGPPNHLGKGEAKAAVSVLAEAFARAYL